MLGRILFHLSIVTLTISAPLEYLHSKCAFLDLTYEFNSDTIVWPTSDPFKKETVSQGITSGGYYYSAFKFCSAEHGGTHLDAPIHFNEHGQSVEQIPLQTFVGEAFVIDVKEKVKWKRDYALSVEDILDYEGKHGRIEDRAILIVNTGYGVHWNNKSEYMGSDVPNDAEHLHFPGVSPEAARWLVTNRTIAVLGIDTASMDPGTSKDFQAHQILLGHNISGFENLRNVDQLPARGATIVALPMSITGGSGAPLRAFAVGWQGPDDPCRVSKTTAAANGGGTDGERTGFPSRPNEPQASTLLRESNAGATWTPTFSTRRFLMVILVLIFPRLFFL